MIPFSLRKAFGMPGIDDQDAMYAYYFYRLVQRTGQITATWNTVREGLSGGELSRLGFQLDLLTPHQVERRSFDFPLLSNDRPALNMVSSPAIAKRLLDFNRQEKPLSPSAIVSFLHCRLKFYFSYVLKLKEEDEVKEEIDRMVFGNIFHKTMETLYLPFVGKVMMPSDFTTLINDSGKIEKAVMEAFTGEFFKSYKGREADLPLEGKSLLIKSTVKGYIRNLLKYDREQAPLTMVSLEEPFEAAIRVEIDDEVRQIRIGGRSDRLDEQEGTLRIVDYKTGTLKPENLRFSAWEQLFDPPGKELKKEAIQSLIYTWIVHKQTSGARPVKAAVYPVLSLKKEKSDFSVTMAKTPVVMPEAAETLEHYLKEILREIYSAETTFTQTPFEERCNYCPFSAICRKG